MPGQYYCNGKIPDCPYKERCFKNGGTCWTTTDINFAGEKPSSVQIYKKYHELDCNKADDMKNIHKSSVAESVIPAIVSIIVSFVTTLIIILAKML